MILVFGTNMFMELSGFFMTTISRKGIQVLFPTSCVKIIKGWQLLNILRVKSILLWGILVKLSFKYLKKKLNSICVPEK